MTDGPPPPLREGHRSMNERDVRETIFAALADYLKRDRATIRADQHLRDDLGLDSMAVIELLYKIEEAFDIQIPDQDLIGLSTVGAVATYVDRRLSPSKRPTSRKERHQSVKGKKK
jgi:acyl carrier protein